MNLSIYRYKPEQGRLTRGIGFLLCSILWMYGCRTFYFFLHWPWATGKMMEDVIPIINQPLNPAFIISCGLFVAGELVIIWFVNRPKLGTLLIETETEMKKVTWPSWGESFNSSLVVLVAVIFFMIFLGAADIFFKIMFSDIIFRFF